MIEIENAARSSIQEDARRLHLRVWSLIDQGDQTTTATLRPGKRPVFNMRTVRLFAKLMSRKLVLQNHDGEPDQTRRQRAE